MPEISRFRGVIIRMYYDEHDPPHLHAEYAGGKVLLDFQGNILRSDLGSRSALRLVRVERYACGRARGKLGACPIWKTAEEDRSPGLRRTVQRLSDVVGIKYRGGYTFHIFFDDGLEGDVDFSRYFEEGPIFEPLKDESFFRQAMIEGGTIDWPNGAGVAPETLYERIERSSRSPS